MCRPSSSYCLLKRGDLPTRSGRCTSVRATRLGRKSIALPMYINQLFVQMLKDFESYDRRGLDMHQLKATYIRRNFKAFVDEIEFLCLPTTRVFYERYDYLVRRKTINKAQLKVELKRKRSIFTSNPQLKKHCEARGLL